MINLEINLADGGSVMLYDVHPVSQEEPVVLPEGAVSVVVWLGTRPVNGVQG
jgi:hypothetical protein